MIKVVPNLDVSRPARTAVLAVNETRTIDVGMAEVLRLLRISLILRVAVSVLTIIGASLVLNTGSALGLVVALPSVVLLVATSVALAKGRTDKRTVTWLLVAALLVQALELAGVRALTRGETFFRPPPFQRPDTGFGSAFELLISRGFFSGTLFTAIPAILGAWVYGKHRALWWAALAVVANVISDIFAMQPDSNPLRFIIGSLVTPGVIVAVLAYFVGSLADQLRQEQRQLETANRQLAEQGRVREQLATSRERVRLSRDLHDTLAHTLAGLVVQMNAIGTLLDKQPDAAKAELKKAQIAAKTGLEETRAAIGDLRANLVEDLGLSGALQRQADVLQQRTGAQVTFQLLGNEPQLNKDQAESLFRIAQEAFNNIERHADAKNVSITLSNDDVEFQSLSLTIRDDGVGFDVSALDSDRFGIRGMRERAEMIGAHLRIDSVPNRGTAVILKLK